jgi:hypothetical protein
VMVCDKPMALSCKQPASIKKDVSFMTNSVLVANHRGDL